MEVRTAHLLRFSSKVLSAFGAKTMDANAEAAAGCAVGPTMRSTSASSTAPLRAYTSCSRNRIVAGDRRVSHLKEHGRAAGGKTHFAGV